MHRFKTSAFNLLLVLSSLAGTAVHAQIDLNTATEIELDGLKGAGPALTRAVLNAQVKAPFQDWPDALKRVKGLGAHKAAQLSAQGVRVQGLPFEPTGGMGSASGTHAARP